MSKFIATILLLLSTFFLVAQKFLEKDYYLIDSLVLDDLNEYDLKIIESSLEKYHLANDDTSRIRSIEYIAEECMDENIWPRYNEWVYNYINDKLKVNNSKEINRKLLVSLSNAINNIGYHYGTKGNIFKQQEYYLRGLEINKKINDKKGISACYNNLGYNFTKQGDFSKALMYYQKGLDLRIEIGEKLKIAPFYNNIAFIHMTQKSYDVALVYFKKGLELTLEINNEKQVSTIYHNIGMVYLEKGDLDLAHENLKKALALDIKTNNKDGVANALSAVGSLFLMKNNFNKAIENFEKSLELNTEIGKKEGISESNYNLAKAYYKQKKYSQAYKYSLKGLEIAQLIGYPEKIEVNARILSKILYKKNDFKEALAMRNLEIKMRDSIQSNDLQKAIAIEHSKFDYEKQKELMKLEHEKQLIIERDEKEKQRIIAEATLFGGVLLVLFIVFIFYRLRIARKQNLIIETQSKDLKQKSKLISSNIDSASKIQASILPSTEEVNKISSQSFVMYKPKDVVAGDFYWISTLNSPKGERQNQETSFPKDRIEDGLLFAVADCTGHGVTGAMMSMICNNALNRAVNEYSLIIPDEILTKTRELIIEEDMEDGMEIGLCSLSVGVEKDCHSLLQYAGAFMPLWIIRNNDLIEILADKQPVSRYHKYLPFKTHTVKLFKNDSIYLFSDGYMDQFGGIKDEKFGIKRFKELLLSIQDKPMDEQKQVLSSTFENWMQESGAEQIDDVCVMGLRI